MRSEGEGKKVCEEREMAKESEFVWGVGIFTRKYQETSTPDRMAIRMMGMRIFRFSFVDVRYMSSMVFSYASRKVSSFSDLCVARAAPASIISQGRKM